jgi:hypothetical protein
MLSIKHSFPPVPVPVPMPMSNPMLSNPMLSDYMKNDPMMPAANAMQVSKATGQTLPADAALLGELQKDYDKENGQITDYGRVKDYDIEEPLEVIMQKDALTTLPNMQSISNPQIDHSNFILNFIYF